MYPRDGYRHRLLPGGTLVCPPGDRGRRNRSGPWRRSPEPRDVVGPSGHHGSLGFGGDSGNVNGVVCETPTFPSLICALAGARPYASCLAPENRICSGCSIQSGAGGFKFSVTAQKSPHCPCRSTGVRAAGSICRAVKRLPSARGSSASATNTPGQAGRKPARQPLTPPDTRAARRSPCNSDRSPWEALLSSLRHPRLGKVQV
ncbi:hypothetical protein SAMN00790413_04288 [Deinococcus hopiensis KR-140]|uniref:Uncharacterized protein n=1 Tax=Deinococcus hopiensis KR-140 TaxID=695939 RepID=A0A1W1UQ99_9DEIO|nr:hypothetical protein SAMN00790413_04288 [Deinococcus hopiensis KR-140]